MLFEEYIKRAKAYMSEERWILAAFYLGKAETVAASDSLDSKPLIQKLFIIDDLMQDCICKKKPV